MTSIADQVLAAAARGDRLAFTAAAARLGSAEVARALVRQKGVLRMADRVAAAAVYPDVVSIEARDGDPDGDPDGRTLYGHFAVFDEWTEIDSWFEGHFLERIAPGAFRKTIRENREQIRLLFQHGMDPELGDKPIATIDVLREDETGGYYEARLLDGVPDLVVDGIRNNTYGASFQFRVMREEFDDDPEPSDDNPKGLPERTLKEVRLYEFGPVTFPAYPSATAGLRSTEADATPPAEDAEAAAHHDGRQLVVAARSSHLGSGRRGLTTTHSLRKEPPRWRLP